MEVKEIEKKVPKILRDILNAELSFGNEVDHIEENKDKIRIITKKPLNKQKIYKMFDRVVTNSVAGERVFVYSSSHGSFKELDGYATDDSIRIEYTTKQTAREILSPSLLPILEFELNYNNRFELAFCLE